MHLKLRGESNTRYCVSNYAFYFGMPTSIFVGRYRKPGKRHFQCHFFYASVRASHGTCSLKELMSKMMEKLRIMRPLFRHLLLCSSSYEHFYLITLVY